MEFVAFVEFDKYDPFGEFYFFSRKIKKGKNDCPFFCLYHGLGLQKIQ